MSGTVSVRLEASACASDKEVNVAIIPRLSADVWLEGGVRRLLVIAAGISHQASLPKQ